MWRSLHRAHLCGKLAPTELLSSVVSCCRALYVYTHTHTVQPLQSPHADMKSLVTTTPGRTIHTHNTHPVPCHTNTRQVVIGIRYTATGIPPDRSPHTHDNRRNTYRPDNILIRRAASHISELELRNIQQHTHDDGRARHTRINDAHILGRRKHTRGSHSTPTAESCPSSLTHS